MAIVVHSVVIVLVRPALFTALQSSASFAACYSQQDSIKLHTNQFVAAVLLPCTLLLPASGAVYSNKDNWTNFAPMGFNGIFRGASVVFFAYLVSQLQVVAVYALRYARRGSSSVVALLLCSWRRKT